MPEYVGKSAGMNQLLNDVFPHEEGQCPSCLQPITGFRDAISRREFVISHLCQACQDSVFEADDEDDDSWRDSWRDDCYEEESVIND